MSGIVCDSAEAELEVNGKSVFYGDATLNQKLIVNGLTETQSIHVLGTFTHFDTTDSTSTSTGAVVLSGGLGIQKNTFTNKINCVSGEQSNDVTTGSAVLTGGLGVGKNANIGGSIAVTGNANIAGTLACTLASGNGLDVSANAVIGGNCIAQNFISTSDARFKVDVQDLKQSDEVINALRPVSFRWIHGNGNLNHGVIAQEVQSVLPDAVFESNDGTLAVRFNDIVANLIASVQLLSKRIAHLEDSLGERKAM